MLQKINRLNIRTYFQELRGTGKKVNSPYFSLYYRSLPGNTTPQLNVIISKKVAKSAVKRNRMRRLLNSALRHLLHNADPKLQGLFFVYKDYSKMKSNELESLIELILQSAGIIKQKI